MMRRTFLLAASFLLFTSLAVAGNRVEKSHSDISVNLDVDNSSEQVLSAQNSQDSSGTPTPTKTPIVVEMEEEEIVTVTPSPTNVNLQSEIDVYIYPGALIESKSDAHVKATSSDNPKSVTDWYENKIKAEGFSVKSFVRTNANDNIKNVIGAAKAGKQIKVEITNTPGGSNIKLDYSRS